MQAKRGCSRPCVRVSAGRLLLAALLAAPLASGAYVLGVAAQGFIALIAVLGLHVTVGMAGQINIAQSAFVGVGAFATAKLSGYGLPFWVVIPLAALITGMVSVLFALPAARVKGFYLALTTLAAQVLFPIVILGLPTEWLGGLVGMPVEPLIVGGYTDLLAPAVLLFHAGAGRGHDGCAAFNLHRSGFGRALKAVRDNDVAAQVMGIDVLRTKIYAFFVGSIVCRGRRRLHRLVPAVRDDREFYAVCLDLVSRHADRRRRAQPDRRHPRGAFHHDIPGRVARSRHYDHAQQCARGRRRDLRRDQCRARRQHFAGADLRAARTGASLVGAQEHDPAMAVSASLNVSRSR